MKYVQYLSHISTGTIETATKKKKRKKKKIKTRMTIANLFALHSNVIKAKFCHTFATDNI